MKTLRPLSISLRLALLFATVAMLAFALMGGYLYQSLAVKMAHHDDAELLVRVNLLRHFLADVHGTEELERSSLPFLNGIFDVEGCILQLHTLDGKLLLQTAVPSAALPAIEPVAASRTTSLSDIRDWVPAAGTGRMLSAIAVLGDTAHTPVRITIAREHSERTVMLKRYSWELTLVVCIAGLLVTLLGFLIVRRGMQPLHAVIGKANDISTHRLNTRLAVDQVPAELQELGKAFNAMLARLEEGVQRLSGFAADLAHDMRTPISTLRVQTEVALAHTRSKEEYQHLLASNLEEYERLAQMIENTLFLARADNAQLAVQRQVLDATAELERIRDYFEGLAEEAGVILTITPGNVCIDADPILFQRAVGNLVSNAIQHTPPGGAIRLAASDTALGPQIAVENSGPGIAPEHMAHIFDRYYRANPARSTGTASAGLGLAIVRAIMELHGGDVSAFSVPNLTTLVRLQFVR
ncbi:heavy metal sensor histidine kinase [Pseudoduganella sp. RAF19]|uniref:heavy metal sensor histidine kinase n=2 Tax=unclassified Pseudoduganella TaxID=2637179 RepID=UPI003F9A4816